jgi:hypothetical protein
MNTIQIKSNTDLNDGKPNNELLRAAGVKRIHPGWYTVEFRGGDLDRSTVCGAKRNLKGGIKQ